MHQPSGWGEQSSFRPQRDTAPRPPLGTINVIFVAPGGGLDPSSEIMTIFPQLLIGEDHRETKRRKGKEKPILGFSKANKIGTFQPYVDVFVVTLWIGRFYVKRVIIDQGNWAEIMYPDLYKGWGLKPKDLKEYDIPLVEFNGKRMIPKGMVRLPVQTRNEVVKVDFVIVDAYFPYTPILARPWLHTMGVVSSTLHVQVKYPTKGSIGELLGC